MFYGCSALISLDLSNFDTRENHFMDGIFSECEALEYINFENTIFNDDFYSIISDLFCY
jgi:surface protein